MAAPTAGSGLLGHPGHGLRLSGMLSPQVRAALAKGDIDVLVPLGAVEQHGPHLPLGTDTVIVNAVAERVAARFPDLLIGPCFPVGCSDHHLEFTGTVSLPPRVMADALRAVAVTLLGHGFRTVYLVTGHAGNTSAMDAAVSGLPPGLEDRVAALSDWPAQRAAIHSWGRNELGLSSQEIGSHAGHFETSILLLLCPEAVQMDAAPLGHVGAAEEASKVLSEKGMMGLSASGVIGDARTATPQAGEGYLNVLVETVVAFIEAHRSGETG